MKILYLVCLGLLKSREKEILSNNFENIMHVIRKIPQEVDIEKVLMESRSIPLYRKKIAQLNEEFEKTFKPKKFGA